MDIDEAADELYAGPPETFTARRSELAAAAKKGGDATAAKEIGRLRRPTVSAWCLNILVAAQDEVLAEVFEVGDALRQAQAALDAARMSQLSARRRALVGQVQRRAADVARRAGQALSPAAQREVEETLAAVVASEDAADAVASGRLTRSLSYAGLGEVDLSGATATPLRSVPRPAPEQTPAPEQAAAGPSAARADRPAPGRPPQRPGRGRGRAPSAPGTAPADLRLVPPRGARESARPGGAAPARTAADRAAAAADAADAAAAAAAAKVEEARAAVQGSEAALAEAGRRADEAAGVVRRLQDELAQARADAAAAARAVAAAERRHASAQVTLGAAERGARGTGRSRSP